MSKNFAKGRVFVGVLALAPAIASAFDLTLQAGYQAEYTDNVGETSTNENSTWIQTPQIAVAASEEGPSLSVLADYNFAREIYGDTFSDRSVAEGEARLDWRAIADRLTFELSNVSTQNTIDSRGATIPTNEQVENTTRAGATLTMDGLSDHKIHLHYDYEIDTAQDTNTDSHRNNVELSYVIPTGTRSRIALVGTYSHVNFDSALWNDYDSKAVHLQYFSQGESFDIDTCSTSVKGNRSTSIRVLAIRCSINKTRSMMSQEPPATFILHTT
jgi:hypothetical protein